ncbi:MAG: hypothetical protein ACO37F_07765 [Pirellulales bacterium]
MLTMVGNGAEFCETKEPAGSLDGVNRPENAGQPVRVVRITLQRDEIPIELVQIRGRFDQKFSDEFIVVGHRSSGGSPRPMLGPGNKYGLGEMETIPHNPTLPCRPHQLPS